MARGPNWIFLLIQQLGAQHKQAAAMERAGARPWDWGTERPIVEPGYGQYAHTPDAWRPVAGGHRGGSNQWEMDWARQQQVDDPLRQGQRAGWGNMAFPVPWRDTAAVTGCLCGRRGCPGAG